MTGWGWGARCGPGVHESPLCENERRQEIMLVATIVAGCAGVLVGLLRRGRIEYLAQLPLRLAWLAGLAWLIQVGLFVSPLAAALDGWAAPILLATLALLVPVIRANRSLPGVVVLGLGLVPQA